MLGLGLASRKNWGYNRKKGERSKEREKEIKLRVSAARLKQRLNDSVRNRTWASPVQTVKVNSTLKDLGKSLSHRY